MSRTVVITGATSGVGRAAAREFAGRGDRLVLASRSPATLAEVRDECVDRPRREVSVGRLNVVMRFGFTVLPGVYDVLVGPLMRLAGLSDRPIAPHPGIVFAPNPAGEAVRGGWLPDVSRAVRSVGGVTAAAGSALLRRLR